MTSLSNGGRQRGALRDQRLRFCWCAVKNGYAMTRLQHIGRHAGAHVTKTDEAHIHELAV